MNSPIPSDTGPEQRETSIPDEIKLTLAQRARNAKPEDDSNGTNIVELAEAINGNTTLSEESKAGILLSFVLKTLTPKKSEFEEFETDPLGYWEVQREKDITKHIIDQVYLRVQSEEPSITDEQIARSLSYSYSPELRIMIEGGGNREEIKDFLIQKDIILTGIDDKSLDSIISEGT